VPPLQLLRIAKSRGTRIAQLFSSMSESIYHAGLTMTEQFACHRHR